MKKDTAIVLLIVPNTIITLSVGAALILLYFPLRNMFLTALAGVGLLSGQIALSVRVYKRLNCRYGISARRYAVYAAMPAAALSVLANIVMYIIEQNYIVPVGWIVTLIMSVYSAVYLVVLIWWISC